MRKKYNIKFNPPELSSEQVNQHQDFDALMAQFEATPPPKGKVVSFRRRIGRYGGGLAIAASVALLIFLGQKYIFPSNSLNGNDLASPYVNPPLEMLKPSSLDLTIDGTKGGVLEYESGSKVIIPPNAFQTESGELVSGAIEIRFKEYHDHIDFFLSGIPMEYDSAGTAYQLESAGMIEIYAYQNGERVFMSPDKKIDIELVSMINYSVNDQYNVYRLDEENRNWVYEGTDDIEPIVGGEIETMLNELLEDSEEPVVEQLETVNQQLATIEDRLQKEQEKIENTVTIPTEPVAPQKAPQGGFATNFDFSDSDLDDPYIKELMEKYSNIEWVISREQKQKYDYIKANADFEEITIEKVPNEFRYETKLIRGDEVVIIYLTPHLKGDDYEKAKAAYEAAFAAFQSALTERTKRVEEQMREIRALAAEEKERLELQKLDYEKRVAELRKKGLKRLLTEEIVKRQVINRFQISSFGIWNCDRPLPPGVSSLSASFKGSNGKWLEDYNGFIANKEKNTIARFKAHKGMQFQYYNENDNIMWIVAYDGKLAICKPEQFKKIPKDARKFTFDMDLTDKPIESEEELRKILAF